MTPPGLAALARLPEPDADLLARYAAGRDGAAFAELVRRHGPAVLAVCRRLARHHHDAEDAFQATFLVLARKADRVRAGGPVGPWLVGVAFRAARHAAARARRRREASGVVPDVPARTAEPFDPDAAAAVLAEVERLPGFLRDAVVLCELGGRSRSAAARELGIPEGTLSSRLAAARKRLAARLAARGFAPVALAAVAVPPRLAAAASAFASGGPVPPAVAALVPGVVRAMLPKLFAAAAVGAVLVVGLFAAAPPPAPAPAPKVAPAAAAVPGPNRLVVWRTGDLVALDPDGANEAVVVAAGPPRCHPQMFAVSPDGKRVAFMKSQADDGDRDPFPAARLFVRTLGTADPPAAVEDGGSEHAVAWSGDGRQLVVSSFAEGATPKDGRLTHFLYTPATKARTPLPLPDRHVVADWSRDGRFFLTGELPPGGDGPPAGTWVTARDGTPHRRLAEPGTAFRFLRFAPDGRRVLAARLVAPADDAKENDRLEEQGFPTRLPRTELVVVDAATARATPLKDVPLNADVLGLCWSPDGRRVAYTWRERHPPPTAAADRETQSHLTVCDADGGNQRTLLTERAASEEHVVLAGVGWR